MREPSSARKFWITTGLAVLALGVAILSWRLPVTPSDHQGPNSGHGTSATDTRTSTHETSEAVPGPPATENTSPSHSSPPGICFDAEKQKVACSAQHVMEVFSIGRAGDCTAEAADYAMRSVTTEDILHVSTVTYDTQPACAFVVSGRNVLHGSLWRLGADALPVSAGR